MTRITIFLLATLLPALSWAQEADAPASLYTAYFDFGSAWLAPADRAAIRRLAARLEGRRPLRVVGYTDGTGPSEYNALLAMRRARAAFRVLVDAGHPASLIHVEARPAGRATASRREMRRVEILAGEAAAGPAGDRSAGAANPLRVGRYSEIAPVPTPSQRNPLETIVRVTFPEGVTSIGEALNYLLARSGWRLADPRATDPAARDMLRLPLPASQRRLGPLSLLDAVGVLCGEAFGTVVDPVHRLVSCELEAEYAPLYRADNEVGP